LRFPGAAAPLQATKAKNQRSRNSYAGFRPRQSPAQPKPWYNAKSSIYARFCVFLAPRPRCKHPRPKTSVAGTAAQDSGHDRAQRGQNPGITQNLTTCVTCYTDRVMTRFLQATSNKRQAQACEGRARGRIEPWRGCGARGLDISPLDKPPSRRRRGCPAAPSLQGLSSGRWDCSAQRDRAQKVETRVDRRSTRVFVFSWA